MWEYKVIAGSYSLDGAEVVVENPLGRGTLQRILDHYGAEGFELASTNYDNINKEIVMLLKRPKGGVAMQGAPFAAAQGAMPAAMAPQMVPGARMAASLPDEADDLPPRRGGGSGGQRRRRSKAELDRLARE